jgi:putative NIF3 family GTP cyclohydrolase 1 type 2
VINPIKDPPPGFEEAGYGRILRFSEPQDLLSLVQRAIQNLKAEGQLEGVSVATPQLIPVGKRGDIKITTVGICAGSGGSMLNGLDVDLLFTGELSHHEALAATEQGRCVMTVFHSNSERGFLASRLQLLLSTQVKVEIDDMERDGRWEQGLDRDFKIGLSEADRDPFEVMTWKNMKEW